MLLMVGVIVCLVSAFLICIAISFDDLEECVSPLIIIFIVGGFLLLVGIAKETYDKRTHYETHCELVVTHPRPAYKCPELR